MPRQRTNVEKIREILRLSLVLKFSIRSIAEAVGISKTSVGEYLAEFKRSGLTYQDILEMSDKEVLEIFEKGNQTANPMYETLAKEFLYYQKELARVGVTLFYCGKNIRVVIQMDLVTQGSAIITVCGRVSCSQGCISSTRQEI